MQDLVPDQAEVAEQGKARIELSGGNTDPRGLGGETPLGGPHVRRLSRIAEIGAKLGGDREHVALDLLHLLIEAAQRIRTYLAGV
mgnify:CR=1 FL=1